MVNVRRLFILAEPEEKRGERMAPLMQPRVAAARDVEQIRGFLRENGLPNLGVEEWVKNFLIIEDDNGRWIGVVGLEVYGESGLLRSVAVDKGSRRKGHGRSLVTAALTGARSRGVRMVYLLTDDAGSYFERLGFQVVDRKDVDGAVKASLEFTEACPESATVMRKTVG
jgi:N-acetylglutamate synthase-like GNAT family acetyltransferase